MEGTANNVMKETKSLIKLGLEIPFVISLSNKLKDLRLIKKDYNKLEDLVNEVWK